MPANRAREISDLLGVAGGGELVLQLDETRLGVRLGQVLLVAVPAPADGGMKG